MATTFTRSQVSLESFFVIIAIVIVGLESGLRIGFVVG